MQDASYKLLKKDHFGEVVLIRDAAGARILRNTRPAPPWSRWLARKLMRREARALAAASGLEGLPALLHCDRHVLAREYLDGKPMQLVKPEARGYFQAARRLLAQLHRAGIVHNDLAKEPNLLVTNAGAPAFVDFQLAACFRRRNALFRLLAREDLRHLLKHQQNYCPQSLTARQRAILATPSLPARFWRATGKRAYLFVTRRLLGWADREGATDRGAVRDR